MKIGRPIDKTKGVNVITRWDEFWYQLIHNFFYVQSLDLFQGQNSIGDNLLPSFLKKREHLLEKSSFAANSIDNLSDCCTENLSLVLSFSYKNLVANFSKDLIFALVAFHVLVIFNQQFSFLVSLNLTCTHNLRIIKNIRSDSGNGLPLTNAPPSWLTPECPKSGWKWSSENSKRKKIPNWRLCLLVWNLPLFWLSGSSGRCSIFISL